MVRPANRGKPGFRGRAVHNRQSRDLKLGARFTSHFAAQSAYFVVREIQEHSRCIIDNFEGGIGFATPVVHPSWACRLSFALVVTDVKRAHPRSLSVQDLIAALWSQSSSELT